MVEQYLLSRHRWPILLEEANGMEDEDQGTNFVTSGRMSMRLYIYNLTWSSLHTGTAIS